MAQVLGPRRPGHAGEGFAKAALLAEVSLAPDGPAEAAAAHRAVALASGFLDPKRDELVRALRKQVVVVVTAQWDVLCFDHNLRLQWTAKVKVRAPDSLIPQAIASHTDLSATPLPLCIADGTHSQDISCEAPMFLPCTGVCLHCMMPRGDHNQIALTPRAL